MGDQKPKGVNRKGHPFDSPFAGSGSLRAGYGAQRKTAGSYANRGLISEVHANLGWIGMTTSQTYAILG
jgi:hypothetical protein